ncbi:MAG: DUF3341 domain-containing protein, partial [Pseudobdellovibrio sp.]
MNASRAVFGIYKTRGDIETVVNTLRANGFRLSDISVLLPQALGGQDFLHVKSSKAPEGATAGAGTGAVLGGVMGLLAGLGSLTIPGLGAFVAAGPLLSTFAGMGVGGAAGAVGGALLGYGIPEYEAKRYEGFVKSGGILISVHVDNPEWADKAKKLLESTGAFDVAISDELKSD